MILNNVTVIGTTFQSNSQWHEDETALINSITQQINQQWPIGKNLLITLAIVAGGVLIYRYYKNK